MNTADIARIAVRVAQKIPKVYDAGYIEGVKIAESKPYINTKEISDFYYFCYNDRFAFDELLRLDTSKGTSFSYMFRKCTNLTTIPQLDTSKGTVFSDMFRECTNLTTIPQLDTSNGTVFSDMFNKCTSLTTIPELDTSNGTDFGYMFVDCTSLTTIPELDTSNGTHFSYMFRECTNLTTIPQLDTSKGTVFGSAFFECTNLTDITIKEGATINADFDIRYSPLTHKSLTSIINALKNNSSSTKTLTLTIGSDNIAKLTEDELNIIKSKGWKYA